MTSEFTPWVSIRPHVATSYLFVGVELRLARKFAPAVARGFAVMA